ncbi:2-oxoglutarate-Fe(II) type oxidoreductase hxnY-like [Triticum dicoccoides]|nr:2-oxoglutarate-Fe(II) type oxidoreductase hxnY-like [Triticum dicoccoides]XP_044320851.1 2-oxoglutarate-dependent dioxygenase 19-like isoform X2 [Triticum aestivum]
MGSGDQGKGVRIFIHKELFYSHDRVQILHRSLHREAREQSKNPSHMAASNGGALTLVDLAPFFAVGDADDAGARARATEAVREACQATGFFRAVNHAVPRELMARALDLSAAFFALPDEEKAKVRPAEGASASPLPVGYARQPAHSADKNEYLLLFNPKLGLNHYPAQPAGFRDALEECYAKLTELGLLIQDILNECMGLPPGFLAGYNADRGFDFLTALRYFPATTDENNGISAHEDGNCITFVLQDGVGGLEVLGEDGSWVPAEPVEGSIVVNVGDVLQVLSNKKFKSATHRVVRRPGAHRHSIAFFLNLHGDKWVEPLPEFAGDAGEPPRYRGFRYNEYMQLRMRNKTHPPSRPEDVVHITHYEI